MMTNRCIPRWRQFFLLCFLFTLLWSGPGLCADVTLAWDPNSEADLEGYGIYFRQGTSGPPYLLAGYVTLDDLDHPYAPSFTVTGLQEGARYYFAATAYNTSGQESAYSNSVCADIAVDGTIAACSSSSTGVPSSSGGGGGSSGGGGGGECFIACAAAGSAGAGGSWPLGLLTVGGLLSVFSLRRRRFGK
jgi:uncharacterized membrane protein YgcG